MPAEYVMAMIGANAAVCHDAQAECTAVGVPAKIIKNADGARTVD